MRKKSNNAKGECIAWLREHVGFDGAECLIWPFSCDRDGYGSFGHEGGRIMAHRWMCEAINGHAPSPEHHAAHSCGKGGTGCVHPKHLDWKTPLENARDKIAHGTIYTDKGRRRQKLTQEQVAEIRAVKTSAEQLEIARRFGVSDSTVRKILYGKSWTKPKRFNDFADDDIRRIRSLKGTATAKVIAAEYEVSDKVIYNIWNRRFWAHVA